MDLDAHYAGGGAWKRAFIGPRLTDRKIAKYEAIGFYTPEAKAKRKAYRENKRRKPAPANFYYGDDGRLIYAP